MFPCVLFPVPTCSSRGVPVGTPALCQYCRMQPGHTYPHMCHTQHCHVAIWAYLLTLVVYPVPPKWWPLDVPVCMPAVFQHCHMVTSACMFTPALCPRTGTWSCLHARCIPEQPHEAQACSYANLMVQHRHVFTCLSCLTATKRCLRMCYVPVLPSVHTSAGSQCHPVMSLALWLAHLLHPTAATPTVS